MYGYAIAVYGSAYSGGYYAEPETGYGYSGG